ncbi:hypothetical protein TI06_23020, partial [Vibrio vulnificus]
GNVEDELPHRSGKTEQVGLVGPVDNQLARLQEVAAVVLVEERLAALHQGDEDRLLGHCADHRAVALHHVLVAADAGQPQAFEAEVVLGRGEAGLGIRRTFQ